MSPGVEAGRPLWTERRCEWRSQEGAGCARWRARTTSVSRSHGLWEGALPGARVIQLWARCSRKTHAEPKAGGVP